ncbi:hypothetical protein DET59_101370 [Rossellomorea aquimaris]|uniref:Uncharacterized protein n=1 Tax=Rossellomorea aquimaris TaxID=189382 RepID=A0A366F016_9BACI|nr:hypothetical protein DET59_101370 [Rossellomorea aquimaris]
MQVNLFLSGGIYRFNNIEGMKLKRLYELKDKEEPNLCRTVSEVKGG